MKVLGIIPARYQSTRFPGKPLIDINGKSMIRRVYEQAKKVKSFSDVVVATDDERILNHVNEFGKAYITSSEHQSGTDRCAEIASEKYDVIINIQGDEPFVFPEQLEELINCFNTPETEIATLVKPFSNNEDIFNPNRMKVVLNNKQEALYFSRSPIPFLRNEEKENWQNKHTFYKHIGLYGYRTKTLKEITKLPVSSLEKAESLEQLRWLENGYKIKVGITHYESVSIDTPEDLKALLNM